MTDIYFTSDLHFYHRNIIKYCERPFQDVDEMNETLINNWNNKVKPDDMIYCLGDLSLAFRPVEIITPRLNGYKMLVPGNHDWCHPYHRKQRQAEKDNCPDKWADKYWAAGWTVLSETYSLLANGYDLILNHLPYTNDRDFKLPDRYKIYRPEDSGRWLLCGHVHEKWKQLDRMINVGVDVWNYQPVHINEIIKIIKQSENQNG